MRTDDMFIRVDDWIPNDEQKYLFHNGKVIIIPFDRIFNQDNQTINTFIIKKESYVRQLNHFTKYINYFIDQYDPEKELLLSYLKLKYMIDNKKRPMKLKAFAKAMYAILFTDSIKQKIIQMCKDNYFIEFKSKKGVYPEALEFNEQHAEIMMRISMCMKLMVPVLFHYLNTNNMNKEIALFTFYSPLFDLFEDVDHIDIYGKLDQTVRARVNENYKANRFIWEQREIMGIDPLIYMDSLLKVNIISETMPKYIFESNIVAFNSVVIERQLGYFIIDRYKHNMIELSGKKDMEGLSGLDKLEMNSAKIDESLIILSNVNIDSTIKRLRKSMNMPIPEEEIDFYKEHHKINRFQVQLVYYYYAKYFGGHRDLHLLNRAQYIKLLVMLKKRLQYQGSVYFPQILTGNPGKLNKRIIQNQKFLTKIENSAVYQSLMNEKFSTLEELGKSNLLLGMLSTILNSPFEIVDYDHPERLGQVIELPNPDILSDEFLSYLNQI